MLLTVLLPAPAQAGSYLFRAAILLENSEREISLMRRRLFDKDLARMLHRIALERVQAASAMHVPTEVAAAHPHLLLVLQGFERALDAAVRGDGEAFIVAQTRGRTEMETFRSVLKQLGWALPALR